MTRRFETKRGLLASSVPVHGTFRARASARVRLSRAVLSAAGLILGLACQNEAAPAVHSEPSREPAAALAPAAPAAGSVALAAPSTGLGPSSAPATTGATGLARYEPAPAKGAAPTPGHAAASDVAAAPVAENHVAEPKADTPTAKAAPGQMIQGAAISEEPFSIWLQATSPVPAGSAATVEAVLVAKPPYHCNADYPHKFKLAAAPAGISYPETTVKGAKVTAERSVLPIAVQAQSAGKAKVSGTLSFSVCNDERCLVEKRDLSLDLEVK